MTLSFSQTACIFFISTFSLGILLVISLKSFKYFIYALSQIQMIFIPLDNPTRNRIDPQTQPAFTFGFVLLFIVSALAMIFSQVMFLNGDNGMILANIPNRVIANYQFWRLSTSIFGTLDGMLGVISVLISFWWLVSLMPIYEKRYSTIHLLVQVSIQSSLVQIGYTIVVLILVRSGTYIQTYSSYFFNLGWVPIIIIWIFKFAAEQPEKEIRICFLPFLIKCKILPWVCSIFFILLTEQRAALVVATVLGFIQCMLLGRSFIVIPACLMKVGQNLYPGCLKNMNSFIKIADATKDLNSLHKFHHYQLQGTSSLTNKQTSQLELNYRDLSENMAKKDTTEELKHHNNEDHDQIQIKRG